MKAITIILLILLLFAASGFYCYHFFGGYEGIGDGNDYAGLARSIVRGEGFSLGHIYPLGLAFNDKIPQPDNMWAPGYPVYLAIWFRLLGISDRAANFASIFALWLLILATYFLASRIIGRDLALMCAALVALSQIILYAAVEGTPEILTGALLAFSIFAILKKQNAPRLIISGLLFAMAALTRYQIAIIAIPLVIIFLENKRVALPLWAVVVVIGVAPWLLRNLLVLGNPLFTLQSYGEFTKGMGRFDDFYFTYRSFTPVSFWYALGHFPFDLARKFVGGLIFFGGAFPLRFNFLGIVPFFFALLKYDKMDGLQKKVVLFAFISAVLVIILSSLDGHHDRHLVPLQPFFVVSTLIGFVLLAKDFGIFKYRLLAIILGLLLFLPARFPFQELTLDGIASRNRASLSDYSNLAEIVKPGEVVISDASDAVWWYADRPSIWIPVHYSDTQILIARKDCRYIYLARPAEFINSLSDNDILGFSNSAEQVNEFDGTGRLFRIIKYGTYSLSGMM